MLEVHSFTGGAFAENGYVATCTSTGETVVVDPGACAPAIVNHLTERDVGPVAILLTHSHFDHVEGLTALRDYTDAPTWHHADDRSMFDGLPQQAAMFGLPNLQLAPPEETFREGEPFRFGEAEFDVVPTPGHAPGHVMFVCHEAGLALSGDLIFAGSVGRTDLPGGSYQTLFESIRNEVLTLPDEMRLLSGHGPETTVGHERRTNPFLTPQYGGKLV